MNAEVANTADTQNWKDGYRKPQQGSFLQIKRQTPSYSFVVMGHINAIASNQTGTWVGWGGVVDASGSCG